MRLPTILAGLALAVAAAAGASRPGEAATYEWGMPPAGYPPFVMAEAKDRPGIYPEIMRAIGEVTGHSFPYRPIPPERGRAYFRRGELALEVMVSPSWYDDDPPDFAVFTDPVLRSDDVLVFPAGEAFAYGGDPSELSGFQVATIRGYRYPGTEHFQRFDLNNEKQLLEFVSQGRTPVGIVNEHVGAWHAQRMAVDVSFGPVYSTGELALHVHKDYAEPLQDELNAAIARLKAEGEIQAIVASYLDGSGSGS